MSQVSDLVTLISLELGLFDDTSKLLIKAYLSKSYIQIWDKYPWGDAQGYANAHVDAGIAIVDYPAGMDHIITLRATTGVFAAPPDTPDIPDDPTAIEPLPGYDSRFLDPVDSTFLIESEPSIYEERGYVKYYEEIGNRASRQIRIYPIPDWGVSLFFFGKMICPGFSADTDEAAIRNIDPALIAYATADMLRRQRQYAKADLEYKKGQELEQAAWNLEQQQANLPRRTKATTVAGNSLSEMTDAVCTICGQWTPDYRLIIREFLRRNYQAMYDVFLWPESLVAVRVPFTTEQVVMPAYIDKVLGVRGSNDMRMFPADAGYFLDVAPSIFNEFGEPIAYTTLTPVAVSTLPPITSQLIFQSTNASDRTKIAVRGEVLSIGQEIEEQVTLNGVNPVNTRYVYDIPLTIAKEITFGDISVNSNTPAYTSLQVLPSYLRELKHQRLWFVPAPSDSVLDSHDGVLTCLVLGKRAIRPLLNDQDTPIITGVQQILIHAAAGDLFTKLEKPDLANRMQQKAGAATDVLKAKNMDQAANSPRFVPHVEPHSYVGDWGGCCWSK